jgi:hypothetical protein
MQSRYASRHVVCLICVASVVFLGGCGGGSKPQPKAEAHLQALAVFYGRYLSQNRGQPPADEKAFKQFLARLNPSEFTSFGLANPDEMFVSPRDNQPYVVRYNVPVAPPGPQGPAVVAYEQTGVGERRYVAFGLGGVEEVDETRFRQLVPESGQSG